MLLRNQIVNILHKAEHPMETAAAHLQAAIKLHQAHMDGTEPTNEESQEELMEHIKAALRALPKM